MHTYAPYDLPDVVARFLASVQPGRIVVMETELWPNLLRAAKRRRIPLPIVNARLSPRSFKGYSQVGGFARPTLADAAHVAARSQDGAERFRRHGGASGSAVGDRQDRKDT